VNHAVGHIELSLLLTGAQDPVVLLVSGGHSLITAFAAGRWRVFGETLDLTVGQLIDQFGRAMGLASPAGPEIERLAAKGSRLIPLPYSVKGNDVSFSGLLTAAKKLLAEGERVKDLCFSLQETAFAMLVEVTERALAFTEKREVLVVGGVAANQRLKAMMEAMCRPHQAALYTSPLRYSGDCGAQIAWTGLRAYLAGVRVPVTESLIDQSWRLDRVDIPWRS
jgi:N6-L-threonylcarbamoyladenine synthase